MHRFGAGILSFATEAAAQHNYHRPTELLVTLGTQAFVIGNGRFVSNRPPDNSTPTARSSR